MWMHDASQRKYSRPKERTASWVPEWRRADTRGRQGTDGAGVDVLPATVFRRTTRGGSPRGMPGGYAPLTAYRIRLHFARPAR